MRSRLTVLCFATMLAAACGGEERRTFPPPRTVTPVPVTVQPSALTETPDSELRKSAPAITPADLERPRVESVVLDNGLRVLVVERHTLPFVTIHYRVQGGTEDGATGAATLTAYDLLQGGTKSRDAELFEQTLDDRGATTHAYANNITSGVVVTAPSPNFAGVLERVADAIQNAVFDQDHVARMEKVVLAGLDMERGSPNLRADREMDRLLDAKSPTEQDTIRAYKTLRQKDLVAFHRAYYKPDRSVLVLSGDLRTETAIGLARKHFAGWSGHGEPLPAHPLGTKSGPRVRIVDRPGGSQVAVIVGASVPGDVLHPDWPALESFRAWLGHGIRGRLFHAIRERQGSTYGVHTALDVRRGYSAFTVSGLVETGAAVTAIERILKEMKRLGEEPPTPEEIRAVEARSSIYQFATISGSADALSRWALTPTEPLDHFMGRLFEHKVPKVEDLLRVAKTYLGEDALHVVLVGDAKTLAPALEKAGLGKAEIVPY